MPQLRLVLLVIGALFILALAIIEVRRSRRSRPMLKSVPETAAPEPHRHREPTLSLPEIHVRHPVRDLPVVEVNDADSLVGLRLDGVHPENETEAEVPGLAATNVESVEAAFPAMVPLATLTPEAPLGVISSTPIDPAVSEAVPVAPVPIDELRVEPPPQPIIDWPHESQRRIYSLRLISTSPERFSGRALRLALAAEGFVLGPFDIFHKPAPDGRVIVSASSLTKPGTFDALAIDTQRFLGVSLFVVLPGPLPPEDAVEEMFRSGREVALRLDGMLQDDHGHAMTPDVIDAMRAAAARDVGP